MANIEVVLGNITQMEVDVLVNAANSSLLGGGGVDGAIHRAAGPRLFQACLMLGGCKTGEAKMTEAFNIQQAQRIVHTVGPFYRGWTPEEAAELLASCYRNSLELAEGFRSVAFPAISTGIYGYPLEDAAVVAVRTIREWADEHPQSTVTSVVLVAFTEHEQAVLAAAL
jgi:O-acetyl-ADP-ribose deacetylase (regulator of RNase III)